MLKNNIHKSKVLVKHKKTKKVETVLNYNRKQQQL